MQQLTKQINTTLDFSQGLTWCLNIVLYAHQDLCNIGELRDSNDILIGKIRIAKDKLVLRWDRQTR